MDITRELALKRIREASEALAAVTEERYRAIDDAKNAGCTNTDIAKAVGISERGIYKLLERRRGRQATHARGVTAP